MNHHDHKVGIISTESIKPSSPTPGHLATFKLSIVDHYMVDTMYMPCIFFYPPPPARSTSSVERLMEERTSVLKSSLAQTLTRLYPLAGRLTDSSPVVRCNDEGVPFSAAAVTDGTMASFLSSRGGVPDADVLEQFLPFPAAHLTEFQESAPQLGARATFFPCGGVAIGVCCLHKIMDAHTIIDFMNLWTAFARGVGDGGAYAHNRAAISLFPLRDDDVASRPDMDLGGEEEEGMKRVTRRFVFDGRAISALKDRARSDRVPRPTRSEVVAAFVWKSAVNAAARALTPPPPGGEGKTVSAVHSVGGMAVDLRPRMKAPWPDYSVGNIFWFPPLTYHDDLQKLVSESRASIEKVDEEFMAKLEGGNGRAECLKNTEAWFKASMADDESKVMIFGVSSMVGKGAYDVDFGWGKPAWFAMATYGNKVNNTVLLIESPIGYGVEAWLTLLEQDMLMLERDPEFLAYANKNASVPYANHLAKL